MSEAAREERIDARANLDHVAARLYADPAAALRAMRHDARTLGAAAVSERMEADFTVYGEPRAEVYGPARERVEGVLREGGLAGEIGGWLAVDHSAPDPAPPREPDPEPGHRVETPAPAHVESPAGDPRAALSAEEALAYDQVVAFAEARERAERLREAEERLHEIADHRASLAAAEASVPGAKAALRKEVEGTYREAGRAMGRIEAALERDGPAETARRIRSGELLGREQSAVHQRRRLFGLLPRRDPAAEAEARERVAKRVETIGYYEGDLGKWSTFRPQEGPAVQGARNVRAALDHEEARLRAQHGTRAPAGGPGGRSPAPTHPAREASQLGRAAQQHLDRLPPESRARVIQAANRGGADRISAAMGHLQTIQMAARTFREGLEGPGH